MSAVNEPLFRELAPMYRLRLEQWLDRKISPSHCPTEMTDAEIADLLQVIAERGEMFDGQTIWIAEAMSRLRNREKGFT